MTKKKDNGKKDKSVLSEKVRAMPRSEFDAWMAKSKAKPSSKARYERDWYVANPEQRPPKPPKGKKYPLSTKTLGLPYDEFKKKAIDGKKPKTQARYWNGRVEFEKDRSYAIHGKDPRLYSIQYEVTARRESDGEKLTYVLTGWYDHPRLSKKELEELKKDTQAFSTTNATVLSIRVVRTANTYSNWKV